MLRLIGEDDYLAFIALYTEMIKSIELHKDLPISLIVADIVEQVKQPDFMVVGDFKDSELVGFVSGYRENKNTWFQTGLFNRIPFRVTKMIKATEAILTQLGYTHWATEYSKQDDKCLAPKLGAKVQTIKYIKEI